MATLSRRALFRSVAAAAGAGVAVGAGLGGSHVGAQTPPAAALQGAGFYRFRLGTKTLTVLGDGDALLPGQELFAVNESPEVFRAAQEHAFQPPNNAHLAMNALMIEEGDRRILIDAGAGHFVGESFGRHALALANAGVDPASIDTVVISHGHFDHFGGLVAPDLSPRFANARVVWQRREHAYWASEQALADVRGSALPEAFIDVSLDALMGALPATAGQTEFVEGETEIAPGVVMLPAPGHTPHSAVVLIESEGEQLLYASDTTLMPVQNAKYPHWVSAFETDAEQLVATRLRLLDRAATDRILWFAYHASFPALGRIRAAGDAWEYVPTTWSWGA